MSKAYQETIKHVSNQILIATIKKQDWKKAYEIAYNDAAYITIPDPNGFYPLHLSVKAGASIEFIILLVNGYQDSVRLRDPDNNLPIHLISYHNKDKLWINISEVASVLYAIDNNTLKMKDRIGNLPIHIALRNKAPDDLILFYIMKYHESAKIPDAIYSNLPIHLALQFGSDYKVVLSLLNIYPSSLYITNKNGSLPIHKAIQFDASMDILKLFIETDSSICSVKDNNGNLALHLLCLFCAGPPSEERLRYVMITYINAWNEWMRIYQYVVCMCV